VTYNYEVHPQLLRKYMSASGYRPSDLGCLLEYGSRLQSSIPRLCMRKSNRWWMLYTNFLGFLKTKPLRLRVRRCTYDVRPTTESYGLRCSCHGYGRLDASIVHKLYTYCRMHSSALLKKGNKPWLSKRYTHPTLRVCLVARVNSDSFSHLNQAALRQVDIRYFYMFGSLGLSRQAELRWCLIACLS
jgi:hypothetical protein